jgi:hypothetical protein
MLTKVIIETEAQDILRKHVPYTNFFKNTQPQNNPIK